MATPEQIAEQEAEWRAQGKSDEEIGARIRELAAQSEATADEPEPEPQTPFPITERAAEPPEGWKPCVVCAGMGIIPEPLQQSGEYVRCPDCNGIGETLTGSQKADALTIMCVACNGNGYVARSYLEQRAAAQAPPPPRNY